MCQCCIKISKFKFAAMVMQLSIFAMTIPPRAPPGICTENSPPLWGFCILIFARGAGIFWGMSRGAGICLLTISAIFGIFIIIARIGGRQHLRVICCSEILYVFKNSHSNFKHHVKSRSVNSAIFTTTERL